MTLALNGQLQTIASDTGHLCAYVKGQGRPLVLVHTINAAASAAEVRPLFESLSQHRTVYAIDLPGYGLSERANRLYTPRLMTDAIHDLVQHIQAVHGAQAIDATGVFVETRRQTHPVWEVQAGQRDGLFDKWLSVKPIKRGVLGPRKPLDRQIMGLFGVHFEQKGAGEGVGDQGHWIIPGQ